MAQQRCLLIKAERVIKRVNSETWAGLLSKTPRSFANSVEFTPRWANCNVTGVSEVTSLLFLPTFLGGMNILSNYSVKLRNDLPIY